jgi:2,3-bisphosphoglycerate-independent phosphoglycerate mutase
VLQAARREDTVVMVTADHGNLETLFTKDGAPHVAHTSNPVGFILIDPRQSGGAALRNGSLCDIAPTVLSALGVQPPEQMTGATLVPGYDWQGRRRVMLVILDGWGIGAEDDGNPLSLGQTPVWDALLKGCPNSRLDASGGAVGLEDGKPGNSEAGHMNIGAGRVVMQDDVRLDAAMNNGSFFTNEVLTAAIDKARGQQRRLHMIALLTEKSSHGSIDYPLALLRMAKARRLTEAFVHVIFDGRSTEPGSAPALLEKLEKMMDEIGLGQVVTGVGRGIALDRDGNYPKTRRAYQALVDGMGRKVALNGDWR